MKPFTQHSKEEEILKNYKKIAAGVMAVATLMSLTACGGSGETAPDMYENGNKIGIVG